MANQNVPPQIERISWGIIEVEGLPLGKDMKLSPTGGRPWDWRETNTHHIPGIQIADVEELINQGAEEIVLSRGMQLMLQTSPETLDFLTQHEIKYHVAETKAAVNIYNELAKNGVKVGGLFHSTC